VYDPTVASSIPPRVRALAALALTTAIATSVAWAVIQDPKGPQTSSAAADLGDLDSANLHGPLDRERYELLFRTSSASFLSLGSAGKPREFSWPVLTDPATPFRERVLAARLGAHAFPFDDVPRLMQTLGALRAEERLHAWGLRPNPSGALLPEVDASWAEVVSRLHAWSEPERSRTILGHVWRAPERVTAWAPRPNDLVEWEAAPWPLQVEFVLEDLLYGSAPKMGASECQGREQCEAWLDSALRLPCTTDDEATLFVQAARAVSHHVTERVLARYRTLVIDARYPRSASRILQRLGEISRLALCAAPETEAEFQVLLLDALRGPLPEEVKRLGAYETSHLREGWEGPKRPQSATLVLELSRRGLDPPDGSAPGWHALYVYLLSACAALDAPPFVPDAGMGGEMRPENASTWIAKYRTWFDAHRAELERAAELERPALEAARARLVELASR